MNKTVGIVGIVGIPACYGGFETLVENLTKINNRVDYLVFCSSKSYDKKLKSHNEAKLSYIPLRANGLSSVFYDVYSLMKCWVLKPDTVLILGVSGCLFLPFFRLFSSSKIVTNIDGLEWRRQKWGKSAKIFLKLSEMVAVKFSDEIVSDNEAITNYVLDEYGEVSSTIAYGGDHALIGSDDKLQLSYPVGYALGLCRIEPENNVEMILDAFSRMNHHLVFIGNWESSEFGCNLKRKYSNFCNITLLDPIYDEGQLFTYRRNCGVYIHGHSAGGTNPSLVEMMHMGVPILAFDCVFNRFTTDESALYFSESNEISTQMSLAVNNSKVSQSMIKIANEKYTWKVISKKYESLY